MRKNKGFTPLEKKFVTGFTLIELMIVVAIVVILGYSLTNLFRTSFDIWTSSLNGIDTQKAGRTAVEEMTRFVRQSSAPVTGITPSVGHTASSISFNYMEDTSTVKPMEYFFSGGALYRVNNGSTSTFIKQNIDSIYFNHISSYVVKIESFTLIKGSGRQQKSVTFERTIEIRNR